MSVEKQETRQMAMLASLLMPLSLFALAGAIVYFTWQIGQVVVQLPGILDTVDRTTEKVAPVIDDVTRVVDLMPDILDEVTEIRQLVPPVIDQVDAVTKQVPPILKQVELTRAQIPPILRESEAIRKELPAMLATADRASASVSEISTQVEASLPRVDRALDEVKVTRDSIPGTLDRVDGLIDKARVAGQEASQGAVTGFFSGIIMAPFALVANAGRSIAGLTEEEARELTGRDHELTKQAVIVLLDQGEEGDSQKWKNEDSGNEGVVTIVDVYKEGEYAELDCVKLKFVFYKTGKLLTEADRAFCKNEDGQWDFDE